MGENLKKNYKEGERQGLPRVIISRYAQLEQGRPMLQGWAILEDFIAIPILVAQNCRELVKS